MDSTCFPTDFALELLRRTPRADRPGKSLDPLPSGYTPTEAALAHDQAFLRLGDRVARTFDEIARSGYAGLVDVAFWPAPSLRPGSRLCASVVLVEDGAPQSEGAARFTLAGGKVRRVTDTGG